MFRHGYIYHDMLAEIGPLNDGRVRTHRSLQLIYGVNKPYRIRLQGEWREIRLCLIDQGVEHFISGEDDWQICYFIYPDSPLGHLLKSAILKDASVSVLSQDANPSLIKTEQPAVRPMSMDDVRGLLESFVYVFTEKKVHPRKGMDITEKLVTRLRREGLLDEGVPELAGQLGMSVQDLEYSFKRETEIDLRTWLMHLRMIRFFDALDAESSIPDDDGLDALARTMGIAGVPGLDRMFEDFFGMPYRRWVNSDVGTVVLTEGAPVFFTYG